MHNHHFEDTLLENPLTQQRGRDSWLVDFDEDGQLDLIQSGSGGNGPLIVRLGNGDGTFKAAQQLGLVGGISGNISRYPFADLDGDGHLDFVYATGSVGNYGSDTASIFAGRRDDLVDLLAVDLNGDGNEEILAVQEQMDRLQVFVGDNLGGFTRQSDLLAGRAPQAVAVADLDGDGQLELLTANRTSRSLSVFSGAIGAGYSSAEFPIGRGPIDVESVDLNDDSHQDILVLDDAENALWLFLGDGTTTLGTATAIALGDKPSRFTIADATGDGTVDAVVTLPDTERLMILPGDGMGAFGSPIYVDLAEAPSDVAVVDLNDDGNPDLAATLTSLNVLSVLYGRGNNQFSKSQHIQVGEAPSRVGLADADEDGRLDFVVANSGDATASVIYNRFDPNEVYRYDADAIDPDDDSLTYAIVDGPGGLIINSETGALLWAAAPDQVGVHDVTISADDGLGGIATQSFKIDVVAARENAAPLIATQPPATIGAGETFTYQATALDNDRDALRYRLIDSPSGATIDPTTGLVEWDGRGTALIFSPYGDPGEVRVAASDSLKPASTTIEGWFNIHKLTASNGASLFFSLPGAHGQAYYLRSLFNDRFQLIMDFDGAKIDFQPRYQFQVDKWIHIALTVDDASKTATIWVDGKVIGSTTIPDSIGYSNSGTLNVGEAGSWKTQATIENFRIWNVALSGTEIDELMTTQYENDARLALDFRFDDTQVLSVHDHSIYGNTGYRVSNGLLPQSVTGLTDAGSHTFTVSIEDGRGGYDEQTFELNVLPELRGSIVGHLFDDMNGDGIQNDGSEEGIPAEPSLEKWHLYIDTNGNAYPDPSEPQTTTDANGDYRFDGLLPGEYPLSITPVAGYDVPTDPAQVAVMRNTETALDLAIEQLSLSHIRGQLLTEEGDEIAYWKVFADLDNDRILDDTEPMAVSDRNGNYALTGLDAGTYQIRPELPAGWADVAGRDGIAVTLAADAISTANNFVLQPTNTSVTGGLHFVTLPTNRIVARQTFRYSATAMGLGQQPVTYDLSLAPEGMTVDPHTGLTAWRPRIDQVGEHLVILRVTDASGSMALQDFYIEVTAPNTTPHILSPHGEPQGANLGLFSAYVGSNYSYDVIAQDAESTNLTFSLVNAPTGATIDNDSGRLNWTPAASAVGSQEFTVLVTDQAGASTTANWTVEVKNETPSILPLDVTLPRSSAAVTAKYTSRIVGHDAIGRPINWTLVSGPDGMTVDSAGNIAWTPSASQLGTQTVELGGATPDGDSQVVSFFIEVTGRALNAIPSIDSDPITSVSLGQTFTYDVQVSDTDRDLFAFALLESPVGMSVHPSLGTIRWTPDADQLGESKVVVQVTDPSGDTDTQEFELKVSRFGGPPRIVSVPPTEASVGTAFLYSMEASDREGDPLTYTLLTAPAGMSIVETTGEIAWTPTSGQLGQQDVVIQVSDGVGGAATQAFVIRVSDGVPNLPPQITSNSPRFGAVGTAYIYTLSANDPESTKITYSLGRGPAGMTIDATTGLVSWTPTVAQAGKHVVTLIATDVGGASAIESFEFDVLAQNTGPVINSTAPIDVAAGALFMYDVLASDVDLDQLTFELNHAPAGAELDSFGRIRWQTEVAFIGSHDFAVKVSDPRGGEAMQSFTVEVIEDLVPPKLSLIENLGENSRNILPWQGPFRVFVKAIDNVAIASLTLKANGQDIPLDASGTATFTFEDWTFQTINATATAIDTNGNITTKTITFDYDFPEGWSGAGTTDIPTAAITSPADTGTVTGMVRIVGTAAHDDLFGYKLSYRHVDETRFTEFHESTTAVTNGELGVWDTSLLLNDEYVIRLEVATNAGVVNVVEHHVGLAGELKLGNFRLSFTDMVIPVAGIPIEITRIYDTLQADREGDFGYGWRLEYRNTDLRVGLPKSGLEDIGIYSALRPGVKVYLNVPGEGRQGFTFNPDIRVLPGFGGQNLVLARPRFTPDPGVTSSLSTGTSSYLQVNEQGELYAPGGIPYNPASPNFGGAYVLTTIDGAAYRIDGATGKLNSAADRNGNVIRFTENGIVAQEQGIELVFERDASGRIISIEDTLGNAVRYDYQNGDLVKVTDRESNETTFTYSSDRPHFLDSVIDPLGRTGARYEYNDDGRLVALISSDGTRVELDFDLDASTQTFRDRLGRATQVVYDNRGNVVAEVDALGGIARTEYDARGNETAMIDSLGNRTELEYNTLDLITRQTDANGNSTHYTYDANGNLLQSIDALGQRNAATFDENGNIRSITSSSGSEIEYTGVSGANPDSILIDGQTSIEYEYDSAERIIRQVSNTGVEIEYQYDSNGNLLRTIESRIKNGQTNQRQTTLTYDHEGRVVSSTDAHGNNNQVVYDEFGNVIRSIAYDGTETQNVRDEAGNIIRREFADGSAIELEYDSVGNLIQRTDRLGRITRFVYDDLNRLIETIHPDGTPNTDADNPREIREYDLASRVIAEIDELGSRTEFEYDATGRVLVQRNALGYETRFEYDALGRATRVTNALNQVTNTEYDAVGNVLRNIFNDGSSVSAEFDQRGNRTRLIDENGLATRFEYDEFGRMIAVVDALGHRTRYQYDGFGNLVSTTDANGEVTRQEFDDFGRLISETLPEGQSDSRTYDSVGRLTSYTDFNGQETEYTYDLVGRLIETTFVDGSSEQFSYDFEGNLLSATNGSGTVSYEYDVRYRLVELETANGQVIEYSYDDVGNLITHSSINGVARYFYDGISQLVRAQTADGSEAEYVYNAVGDLVETFYSNGITIVNELDSLGRVTSIQHRDGGGNLVQRYDYDFDPTGRLRSVSELDGRVTNWTYDAAYRLLREQSISPVGPEFEIAHVYDAVGNRLHESHSELGERDFEYDGNNRLTRIVAPDGVSRYEYDANGNLIAKVSPNGDREDLVWDAENQLVEQTITKDGVASEVEYEYDATGNRIKRVVDGEVTEFVVDPIFGLPQVIAELDGSGNLVVGYGFGLGRVTQTQGGVTLFVGSDRHSGTRVLYDGSGGIVEQFLFDAYGRELTANSGSGFLYRGEQRDAVTGLDFLRARYYSPDTGSFISRDPFSGFNDSPMSLNEYLYAGADPINNSDPTGEFWLTDAIIGFAVRNKLNIALAVGFTAYRAHAEFKVSGFSAQRLLVIAAQEAAIAVGFGILAKALQTIRVGINPGLQQLVSQQARLLPGYERALQGGINTVQVAKALQALATATLTTPEVGGRVFTAVVGGTSAVVRTAGKAGGFNYVSLVKAGASAGGRFSIRNPERALIAVRESYAIGLGIQYRFAANVPQFTALLGQILYAGRDVGNPQDNLPVADN